MQQMIFIADLIVFSTCFGNHYAHHQVLESIIQVVVLPVVFGAWFSSCRYGVELRVVCPVCGLLRYSAPHHTDNLKTKHQIRQAATTCIILSSS